MRALVLLFSAIFLSACNPFAPKISVEVTDDTGTPVPNARVRVGWSSNNPWGPDIRSGDSHSLTIKADSRGFASVPFHSPSTAINVTHPGHYHSYIGIDNSIVSKHSGSAAPIRIVLKRILAPRPLIAKRAWIVLPSLSGEAAYDFVAGDLVSPHGKGTSPDVWFVWSPPVNRSPVEERRCWDMAFRDTRSGIIARLFSNDYGDVRSDLVTDQTAPETGYLPLLSAAEAAGGFDERAGGQGALYYFRVTRGDTSFYGTIFRGEPMIKFYTNNPQPVIRFTYALNPTGDRSVEPDPVSTTFPKSNGYEEPVTLQTNP